MTSTTKRTKNFDAAALALGACALVLVTATGCGETHAPGDVIGAGGGDGGAVRGPIDAGAGGAKGTGGTIVGVGTGGATGAGGTAGARAGTGGATSGAGGATGVGGTAGARAGTGGAATGTGGA